MNLKTITSIENAERAIILYLDFETLMTFTTLGILIRTSLAKQLQSNNVSL